MDSKQVQIDASDFNQSYSGLTNRVGLSILLSSTVVLSFVLLLSFVNFNLSTGDFFVFVILLTCVVGWPIIYIAIYNDKFELNMSMQGYNMSQLPEKYTFGKQEYTIIRLDSWRNSKSRFPRKIHISNIQSQQTAACCTICGEEMFLNSDESSTGYIVEERERYTIGPFFFSDSCTEWKAYCVTHINDCAEYN